MQTDQTAPLKLGFLISAYNTAQRMIWFSDQKASVIVIYYGILLSMLGPRVDRGLTFLRAADAGVPPRAALVGLMLAFLASMAVSLSYALRTILPSYVPPVEVRDHKRLYWCDDILARDVETYFETLRGLDGDGLLKEMTRELYSAVRIEKRKFDRVTRSIRWAVASFALWVLLLVSTFLV